MRFNSLCVAVFAIAKTAIILGSQELSVNDVASQDHSRLKRDDNRYQKRVKVLKKRNYHGRPSDEVHLNTDEITRLQMVGDKLRHISRKRKFLTTSESYFEAASLRPEENMSIEKQEENEKSCCTGVTALKCDLRGLAVTLAEPAIKNDHDVKSKNNQPHKILAQHLQSRMSKPFDGPAVNHKMCSADCSTECPNNLENIYVCNKCRSHYVVRVSISESKCEKDCPGIRALREAMSLGKIPLPIWDDNRGKREPFELATASPTCSECPNSLETMFQCPKCFTWYTIKINFKESKCNHEGNQNTNGGNDGSKHGTRESDEGRDKREYSRGLRVKPCSCDGSCTTQSCLNSIEQMFKCTKCRTHYIVRLNLKESKCSHGPGPASSSRLGRLEDQDIGLEENGFRKKLPRPYQRKFRKQPLPSLLQI